MRLAGTNQGKSGHYMGLPHAKWCQQPVQGQAQHLGPGLVTVLGGDEMAADRAVIHLAWAEEGAGRCRGQMAIYVKPRGGLGRTYMALIRPFRYAVVYPALMRQIERAWQARTARQAAAPSQ